jgi:LuxR family maltose regulon positive regulatory protein
VAQPGTADAPAASPGAPGIVSPRALYQRLARAGRAAEVSAPAGSEKTVLLRSSIREAGLADRAAWITVHPAERDAQPFSLSIISALRDTANRPRIRALRAL